MSLEGEDSPGERKEPDRRPANVPLREQFGQLRFLRGDLTVPSGLLSMKYFLSAFLLTTVALHADLASFRNEQTSELSLVSRYTFDSNNANDAGRLVPFGFGVDVADVAIDIFVRSRDKNIRPSRK